MKQKYIHCTVQVNKEDISRRNIDGVEHITMTSFTLPDNIVMNGGLYPTEEIDKSYHTLEGTLAPLEHPTNANGEFLSSIDPDAIHNFHIGAFNENVEKVNGRIRVDKTINVPFAMKSDKGKRVLDRINELETSPEPRPIHTSVGVYLEPEFLDEPRVNSTGQEYIWIAKEMVFDHDAILLDNVGAAQPHQGVGIGVNKKDPKCEVESFILNADNTPKPKTPTPNKKDENMKEFILNALKKAKVSTDGLNDDELFAAYNKLVAKDDDIKKLEDEIKANAEKHTGQDEKIKKLEDTIKANAENEGDGDDPGDGGGDEPKVEAVIANALKPLTEQMAALSAQMNKSAVEQVDDLIKVIVNSKKYDAMTEDDLKKLGIETLQKMSAGCPSSYGVSAMMNNKVDKKFSAPTEAPE